jgi:hypothetical protein
MYKLESNGVTILPFNEYSNSKCCYRQNQFESNELAKKLPSLYKSRVSLLFDCKLNQKSPVNLKEAIKLLQKPKQRQLSEIGKREFHPQHIDSIANQFNCVIPSKSSLNKYKNKHNMRPCTSNEVSRPESRYNKKFMYKQLEFVNKRENDYYVPIVKWGNEDGEHEYVPEFWSDMKSEVIQ